MSTLTEQRASLKTAKKAKQSTSYTDPAAALLKHKVSVSSTIRLLISSKIILKRIIWRLQTATPTSLQTRKHRSTAVGGNVQEISNTKA